MTTIAYKKGVMASDSRGYSGDKVPVGNKTKMVKFRDGTLLGISSVHCEVGQLLIDWIAAGSPRKELPPLQTNEFQALHVMRDGSWFYYHNSFFPSGPLTGDFVAIGSGDQYAFGALAMGASAQMAVEVACEMDPWSAGPIHTLHLGETI